MPRGKGLKILDLRPMFKTIVTDHRAKFSNSEISWKEIYHLVVAMVEKLSSVFRADIDLRQ